jgi:hypothetical protein
MFMASEIELESMKVWKYFDYCNGKWFKYILLVLFCYTWRMLDSGGR